MTWSYSPYAGILHLTTLISIYIACLALSRRNKPGVGTLALLMFAVAEWSFTSGLEAASIGIQAKVFWSKMEYVGAVSAPMLFFVFALEYGQKARWVKPIYLVLLSIFPIIGFIAAVTNESHGLIWTGFTPLPSQSNTLIYEHGIGYFILIAYDYLMISIGIITLMEVWLHVKQPYRRQVGILLLGSIFPFMGGIVYTLVPGFLPGLDLTPITFSVTGIVMAYGVFKFRLFDLTPIARDMLIEKLEDGILVLDAQNRVVDINPVAQNILGINYKEYLGQPVTNLVQFWPGISERLQESETIDTEFRLSTDPARYIQLHISPLRTRQDQLVGRLLVFRDVTRRQQTEAELAHTIEELGILNQISLAVTSGLDMEHVLKTLYEQCSQLVSIDIFYVAIYDEINSLIHIPIYYERGHFQTGPTRDIKDHPGTIGAIIQSRKTIYINDGIKTNTSPLTKSTSILDKPTRSYIGIPLTLRDRVIGVISIQNYRPDAYTEDQIRILERIAVQVAIAVENARLYGEVQRLAIIDELTGVYNYRGLQELGAREVERAQRFNRPLSILFFDIDDFRDFNNTYNHATGNIILRVVSERCHTILRSVDVLGRFGGDEFVALLPETDIANAEAVARRMVDEIANIKIPTPFGEMSVTISIGISALSEENQNLAELIDRANHAEHQAKAGKKGIVKIAS